MHRTLIAEVNAPCSFLRLHKIIASSVWYYITAVLYKPFAVFQKTLSLKWELSCRTPSCFTYWYNELTHVLESFQSLILMNMEWKPTDVTILFVCCWISTCFGPTGPSSREFVQLFTQPLVQYLCRSAAQILNQWLCEQLYELSWSWACGPETCRDPAI